MRQGHNNNMKRSRGRGRHNKPQHNANRTLESNGPDVKVRGPAQTIYEKYQQLARDANSAGDRVMAENYLQHAEHYYRLVLTYQAQQPQGQAGQPGQPGQPGQGHGQGGNGRHANGNGPSQSPEFQGMPGPAFPGEEMDDEGDDEGEEQGQPRS